MLHIENSRIISPCGSKTDPPAYPVRLYWLPALLSEPALFHACVGYASLQCASVEGKPKNNSYTAEHMGEAIRLVRNRLEDDPLKATSDGMIAAILLLIGVEVSCFNPKL